MEAIVRGNSQRRQTTRRSGDGVAGEGVAANGGLIGMMEASGIRMCWKSFVPLNPAWHSALRGESLSPRANKWCVVAWFHVSGSDVHMLALLRDASMAPGTWTIGELQSTAREIRVSGWIEAWGQRAVSGDARSGLAF
ncbi:MAG: hypothetical protein R3C49_22970 [Planctomycetaceae bacterium]